MVKIMAVDDSNLMVAVIRNFIRKERPDYQVIEAHTGEESIEKYKTERPDLVFMDIKMPGIDGITALERILGFDSSAKIVMCTALKEAEQEERARKAGAKGYLTKPFSKEDILTAIKKNIEGDRS